MATGDTKQAIMAAARTAVQMRGYNALSFRDLATEVGIKSSSVHYYFPTKGDLGAALARQYTDEFLAYLHALPAPAADWQARVNSYVAVFRATLSRENRMCVGGILAAERPDLAPEVVAEVERFTTLLVDWLAGVLAVAKPALAPAAVRKWAQAVFAAIEGAQLVARGVNDVAVFDDTIDGYRALGLLPA